MFKKNTFILSDIAYFIVLIFVLLSFFLNLAVFSNFLYTISAFIILLFIILITLKLMYLKNFILKSENNTIEIIFIMTLSGLAYSLIFDNAVYLLFFIVYATFFGINLNRLHTRNKQDIWFSYIVLLLVSLFFSSLNNELQKSYNTGFFSVFSFYASSALLIISFSSFLVIKKDFDFNISNVPKLSNYNQVRNEKVFLYLTDRKSGFKHYDEYTYECKVKTLLNYSNIAEILKLEDSYEDLMNSMYTTEIDKDSKLLIYKIKLAVSSFINKKKWYVYELESCSGKMVFLDKNRNYRVIFSERQKRFQIMYVSVDSNKKYYWWSSDCYQINDILGFEIRDGSKTIADDKMTRNALVGNLVFGRIGAIIGASISSDNVSLIIKLNDIDNPVYEVKFDDSKTLHSLLTLFQIYEKKWL